jgi:hypothetical protein
MGQQFAGQAEAERLPSTDRHWRQGIGFVREAEPVLGVVVLQGRAFLVAQEVKSHATVRREVPNSAMKSLLLGGFPPSAPSRTIWTMRRMR